MHSVQIRMRSVCTEPWSVKGGLILSQVLSVKSRITRILKEYSPGRSDNDLNWCSVRHLDIQYPHCARANYLAQPALRGKEEIGLQRVQGMEMM